MRVNYRLCFGLTCHCHNLPVYLMIRGAGSYYEEAAKEQGNSGKQTQEEIDQMDREIEQEGGGGEPEDEMQSFVPKEGENLNEELDKIVEERNFADAYRSNYLSKRVHIPSTQSTAQSTASSNPG